MLVLGCGDVFFKQGYLPHQRYIERGVYFGAPETASVHVIDQSGTLDKSTNPNRRHTITNEIHFSLALAT
jgi:hypothetical protein